MPIASTPLIDKRGIYSKYNHTIIVTKVENATKFIRRIKIITYAPSVFYHNK